MAKLISKFYLWLKSVATECMCPHSWGPVLTYRYKGQGVAEIFCQKCGKRDGYTFEYEEEDAPEYDAQANSAR